MEFNKTEWTFINKWSKKIKSINFLGGKCKECGCDDFRVLEFHHLDGSEKDDVLSRLLNGRWSEIKKELNKCILLCSNCHKEHHYNEEVCYSATKFRKTKQFSLNYKNIDCCERCGYSGKNFASLEFHHKDPSEKNFNISRIRISKNNIQCVIDEIDKCEILCSNCHSLEHIDIDRIERLKEEIINKSRAKKEVQSKIDRNKVRIMLESGMRQIEISRELKASKGTISDIVKEISGDCGEI